MKLLAPLRFFSARPAHPVGPDGRMALSDHLRELRARILRVALVALIAHGVALYFFGVLYDLVYGPYQDAAERLAEGTTFATTSGAAATITVRAVLSTKIALRRTTRRKTGRMKIRRRKMARMKSPGRRC